MKLFRFLKVNKLIYGVLLIVAMTVYFMKQNKHELPVIINNYLNDLLCLPIVLGIITYTIRYLKKDPQFKLPLFFVICLATYYAVYFEYYQPKVNVRYTSDWIDVILYYIGGISYFFVSKYNFGKKE